MDSYVEQMTLSWLWGHGTVITTRTNAEDGAAIGTVAGFGNRPNGTYASHFFEVEVMKWTISHYWGFINSESRGAFEGK